MEYSSKYFNAKIIRSCNKTVQIICNLKNIGSNLILSYSAAKPPDYRQSYTGSALPFPDGIIAFQNSKNFGAIQCKTNVIEINMDFPNSYYSHVGTRIIPPYVKINIIDKNNKIYSSDIIELGEIAPFRLLSYPSTPTPRDSPTFYSRTHLQKSRTQEQILRDSEYQIYTPSNFWNGAIPHP